jgi:phage regulator Rha-like protein
MNVIRFPTHLVSTLEISEAVGWPHSELMKDARATAAEPGMPAEWFRLVTYRDESGSVQDAFNMTYSGVKMLLWNCSGPRDLRRRCLYAMRAIVAMSATGGDVSSQAH